MANPFRAFYRIRRERKKAEEIAGLSSTMEEFADGREFKIRGFSLSRRRVAMGLFAGYVLLFGGLVLLRVRTGDEATASAYAKEAETAVSMLSIPSIGLVEAPVSEVELDGRVLTPPDYIVGRYVASETKTLLMGHSATIFAELSGISAGDEIVYEGKVYHVALKVLMAKSEISMKEILKDEEKPTLVLMTCAGEHLSGQDYSHRLIVFAE